jgi:hypothetical protein
MSKDPTARAPAAPSSPPGKVLSVHPGHSANCSSIGSVVDFLFLSGTAGAALLSAVTALLTAEPAQEEGALENVRPSAGPPDDAPEPQA